MRRKEREIINYQEIESIISKADVCRIAMVEGNKPYIVTLNFGYTSGDPSYLYFHCANKGRKLDIIKKNNLVCFEMDVDHELITAEKACGFTMNFKSIIGYGKINIVESTEEKIQGLNCIMKHYSGKDVYDYEDKMLEVTTILKLEIEEITAKQNK